MAARIAELPGVTAAEPRIVVDVLLDVPGLPEPATGRLVSIPRDRHPALNDLYLRRGRWIAGRDEVMVSEAFARANGLEIGSTLGAVIHGRWERLRIVGVALSPEYIYEIRGGGDVFPDNRRFGAGLPLPERPLPPPPGGERPDAALCLPHGGRLGRGLGTGGAPAP